MYMQMYTCMHVCTCIIYIYIQEYNVLTLALVTPVVALTEAFTSKEPAALPYQMSG